MTSSTLASFIHLRTHSSYSLAEGAIKVSDLVKLAVDHRMPALAITDTNNLFCALEFSKQCADHGIQPIIGCLLSIEVTPPSLQLASTLDRLVLYAQNQKGYQNLLLLMSQTYENISSEHPPHLPFHHLNAHNTEGLICLTGWQQGSLARFIRAQAIEEAETHLQQLQQLFQDRLYIEIARLGEPGEPMMEEALIDLAYKYTIPLVATNEVFFATRKMHEAHDALLCIAEGRYVAEEHRRRLTPEHYFKSSEEMEALFSDIPEALHNTLVIAKRCAIKAEESAPMLPTFDTGEGKTEEVVLREQAERGLENRLQTQVFTDAMDEETRHRLRQEYLNRLHFELNVIISMKFPGYFLIVSDFIKWSKRQQIPVGPGRGSGAGSVVAWCLEITDLNPLRFGLLFERFLNPERVSMPDFDIDFCQDRRDEVIEYVQQRYGYDRVAQIITFGKLQARAVVRDVGRVLQMPYSQVDKISKLIPNNPANPVTLSQAIELEPLLQQARNEDADVEKLLNIALQLEGLYRHASTHAAGVVIADRPLHELVPLYRDPRSTMPVVQYSMKYAEMAGLVKFDFLGLRTLTIIEATCKLIRQRGIPIDMQTISLEDPTTFQLLSRGETLGVFQFESTGMRDALRKMKPDTIEDLIALGALYRPGPMDNIPTYIACKHGLESPDYLHPLLEPILKETFGVIIYQEQVMQIAQVLSGYTLGAADLLRRAMGKKIKAEMDAQRELFVNGAIDNGVDAEQASRIFDLVAKFAGYGFNKSHAAAYALISYQTAYLKANFPVEFLVASMNLEIHDTDKLDQFRQEAVFYNIPILPPEINRSQALFSVTSFEKEGQKIPAIQYGMGALKNVGIHAVELMVQERVNNGPYRDIYDFASRNDSKVMNKRQLESLIKAGAFDTIEPNRHMLFEAVETLTRFHSSLQREKDSQQISFFEENSTLAKAVLPLLPSVTDWPALERLQYEREAVGFYLTAHPLDHYATFLQKAKIISAALLEKKAEEGMTRAKLAGAVNDLKMKVSAKGRFGYLQLSDSGSMFEVAIFDEELLMQTRTLLERETLLYVVADIKRDEGGIRLIADSIMPLNYVLQQHPSCVTLHLHSIDIFDQLKSLLNHHGSGNTTFTLIVYENNKQVTITLPKRYELTPPLLRFLEALDDLSAVSIN